MVFQAGVAVAVLAVIGVFVSRLIVTEFHKPSEQLPNLGERRAQYERLIALYPTTPGEEPKAAIMLLEQAKISYERIAADRSALETRATTLVGLAAAATGASTLFAGPRSIVFTPTLVCAALLAILALAALLFILRLKFNPQPNPASLVLTTTVWDEDVQFRICLSLAENYSEGVALLLNEMKLDRIAILMSGIALVGATTLVVANRALSQLQPAKPITCSIGYGEARLTVECPQ